MSENLLNNPLFIIVIIACLLVLIILMVGIGGFSKGGKFNRKYSNKIMRLRILFQAIAVIIILIFVYFKWG